MQPLLTVRFSLAFEMHRVRLWDAYTVPELFALLYLISIAVVGEWRADASFFPDQSRSNLQGDFLLWLPRSRLGQIRRVRVTQPMHSNAVLLL